MERSERIRLYLDTSDLISIGDGKEDSTVVAELFHQCERQEATLLVSAWHIADMRNAPPDAKQRIVDAIERFPRCSLATLEDDGVALCLVPSLDALLTAHAADVQMLEQQVNDAVYAHQSSPSAHDLPVWLANLSKRLMAQVIENATTEEEAVEIARAFLVKHRRRIPAQNAEALLEGVVVHVWPLRNRLADAGHDPKVAVKGLMKPEIANVPNGHVGRHLGDLVNQRRQGQRDRAVQRGDLADRNHVQFAPYVDVFTGDHDVCTWLAEWRTLLPFERQVEPVTSRHLRQVVTFLKQR